MPLLWFKPYAAWATCLSKNWSNGQMKLFHRIFAILRLSSAIFVASFSFGWCRTPCRNRLSNADHRTTLMGSIISAFRHGRGRAKSWRNGKTARLIGRVRYAAGDEKKIFWTRHIDSYTIERARLFAAGHPHSNLRPYRIRPASAKNNLFFTSTGTTWSPPPAPAPVDPRLPLAPIWHELIILSFIIVVGLLMAYIRRLSNIAKPIRILGNGMDRVINENRNPYSPNRPTTATTNCPHLAIQSDKMVENSKPPKNATCSTTASWNAPPVARMQAIVGLIESSPKQNNISKRLEANWPVHGYAGRGTVNPVLSRNFQYGFGKRKPETPASLGNSRSYNRALPVKKRTNGYPVCRRKNPWKTQTILLNESNCTAFLTTSSATPSTTVP